MSKSHVGLEYKVCLKCNKMYETGAVLLDRRLRDVLDRETITGYGVCDECKTKTKHIKLIEIDSDKNMTGRALEIKSDKWNELFTIKAPKDGVAFIDSDTYRLLSEGASNDI